MSHSIRSLRFPLGSSARRVIGLRRPMTADGSVLCSPARRGPVTFSEWRGVLDALAALPQIASGGCGGGASSPPDALNKSSRGTSSSLGRAGAHDVPLVLSERRLP